MTVPPRTTRSSSAMSAPLRWSAPWARPSSHPYRCTHCTLARKVAPVTGRGGSADVEAERPVEPDDLAVEEVVLGDLECQACVLVGPAHALGVGHHGPEALLGGHRVGVGVGEECSGGDAHDADAERREV